MSVINQMLRDLDRREASSAERSGLAGQVKALPPPRRSAWPRLALMLAGAAGLAAIVLNIAPLIESQPWRHAGPVTSAPNIAVAAAPPAPAATSASMPALTVPMPTVKPAPKVTSVAAQMAAPAAATAPMAAPAPSPRPPARETSDGTSASAAPAHAPVPAPISAPTPAPAPDVTGPAPPPATPAEPVAAIDKRPLGQGEGEGAEAVYRQGMAAYRQGRTAEAFARFQKVLAADPRHVAARQALLSLLMAERRLIEAQAVASEGLALDAAQPGWAMTLARLQFEHGQLAEAERTMATHRRHGERSPDYLAFHGLLLERQNRHDEARAAYQKALESGKLTPELAEAIEQRLR